MGLIFFNLMILTVTLTALLLLVFGIIFAKNKDKSNPKRSNGVWLIVLGTILLPLFLILDIYFLVREASEGANVIGNGVLLLGSFFIWPIVLIVDAGVLTFYLAIGISFIRSGKDRKTKEIVAIDHYVLGRLLIIFGIAYIVCALGATFIPPSFLG
jgi:hypothetical protein